MAKDSPVADYVCWKSFTAHAPLSDAEMQSAGLIDRIVAFARLALPLLEWGWDAIDETAPAPIVIPALRHKLPQPDF